jgi:hypothetical protein
MPNAENNMPPHQQQALTTPAFRGPACSSHPPHNAAEQPKNTKNRVYIHPKVDIFQSQSITVNSWKKPMSLPHGIAALIPTAFDNGNQNTEKPYAMPIHKCIANAAGGTNHRLKPGCAMMRSLSKNPAVLVVFIVDLAVSIDCWL